MLQLILSDQQFYYYQQLYKSMEKNEKRTRKGFIYYNCSVIELLWMLKFQFTNYHLSELIRQLLFMKYELLDISYKEIYSL